MPTKSSLSLRLLLLVIVCLGVFTSVLAQQSYPPSETITYQDLDGNTSTLRAFSGRYVRYALPESWIDVNGAQGLSPSEVVTLIDRTDSLYGQLTDLLNSELRGDGLMTIAVVPLAGEGGVQGTALLGVKRCEIASGQLSATKSALAQGTLSETILHEVAHTFDLYRNYLSYYPDSSHSWTEFWIPYIQYLLRMGSYSTAPETILQEKIYNFTARWDARATINSWEQCVKSGNGCEGVTANGASAGLLLRYARLHGRQAVARVFQFYKNYKAAHDPNEIFSFTPEQKNDLLAEALSYGISLDVSRELDAWYWPVSAEMRSRLQTLYPAPNPNLLDSDGDGWSPARGDLDDTNPGIYPGATEVLNGRDDDCDGFVDDVRRMASTTVFTPPARLTGHLRSGQSESYRFNAPGTLIVRTRVTSGSFTGQVSILADGQVTATKLFALEPFRSSLQEFTLPSSGPWLLRVDWLSGGEGDYEVVVAFPPAQEGMGTIFALPLRAPASTRAHTLVPNGLARAVVTLPGANAAEADARADAQGNWTQTLSGFEVFVNGLPSTILSVRRSGSTYTIDFVVSSQVAVVEDGRASLLVRHMPSGAQWSSSTVELRDKAPALWAQGGGTQAAPLALALESPSLMAFNETHRVPAGGETRVMLFASCLGLSRGAGTTRLIAELEDGRRVLLPVEYAGPLIDLPGVDQIIFKADSALASQTRVLLTIEGGEESWVTLPVR
jgi:uncharacterized protein (TIGR03437 family)